MLQLLKRLCLFFVLALYYVSVTTADDIWAGTDADVFIQIFGENGNASAVELTKSANYLRGERKNYFHFLEHL